MRFSIIAVCLLNLFTYHQVESLANIDPRSLSTRRTLFQTASFGTMILWPLQTDAAIDVSGLRLEGSSGSSTSNPGSLTIKDQLKKYDGSGAARIEAIVTSRDEEKSRIRPTADAIAAAAPVGVATWALRATEPQLKPLKLGTIYRYEGQVVSPKGPMARNIFISFEFPSDWLQLDKSSGGIQYVDQRNGDKVYIFRVKLPEGESLPTVPKSFFAEALFNANSSLIKSGQTVEDYKATSSKMNDCSDMCAPRRRIKLKYATVTGNGLRVERRGLIDAYQVENEVYFILTSTNAVKFEKDGPERETAENMADSFRVDQ